MGSDKLDTYRFCRVRTIIKVLFVQSIIDHIGKSCSEVRVAEPTILQLEFETSIHSNKKSIFPSLQTQMSTNNKQHCRNDSYNLFSGRSLVFFPGCGQVGQEIATLPFDIDPMSSGWRAAPPCLRSWR